MKKSRTAKTQPIKLDLSSERTLESIKKHLKFPWPYKDGTVEEVSAMHFLEYVPGKDRGKLMDEIYRVLTPGGRAVFLACYWSSLRAIQDYLYEWPPLSESSFLYFNKAWRQVNVLDGRDIACDFDFSYGYNLDPEAANRNDETRAAWIKRNTNVALDVQVVLTKRKE